VKVSVALHADPDGAARSAVHVVADEREPARNAEVVARKNSTLKEMPANCTAKEMVWLRVGAGNCTA